MYTSQYQRACGSKIYTNKNDLNATLSLNERLNFFVIHLITAQQVASLKLKTRARVRVYPYLISRFMYNNLTVCTTCVLLDLRATTMSSFVVCIGSLDQSSWTTGNQTTISHGLQMLQQSDLFHSVSQLIGRCWPTNGCTPALQVVCHISRRWPTLWVRSCSPGDLSHKLALS